jgi:ABC-type lipoprotein export system ATPase subunit
MVWEPSEQLSVAFFDYLLKNCSYDIESKCVIKNNEYIHIEKLSSGERIRLLIAKNIYNIKKYNFNILLFDEIDENLNDDLAYEICNHIKNIFNDKIILYISHNTIVKKLFTKKIIIKDGVIIL